MRRYVDESRKAGAVPVLVTPMVRRVFDAAGKIEEGPTERSLATYADAMKDVRGEEGGGD